MHAQRCPVAKMRAAAEAQQQSSNVSLQAQRDPVPRALMDTKGFKDPLRKSRMKRPMMGLKASFFQRLHGDAAPRLSPHPQMYGDDAHLGPNALGSTPLASPFLPNDQQFKFSDVQQLVSDTGEILIYNENCAVHGRRASDHYAMHKSASCPTPSRHDACHSVDVERLKNWRRNSLTIKPIRNGATPRAASMERQRMTSFLGCDSHSGTLSSSTSTSSIFTSRSSSVDSRSPRSQFRRAWSLFIPCDEPPKEKPPPKRILRQPTRHVYRRGVSGLPVECTHRYHGVAF